MKRYKENEIEESKDQDNNITYYRIDMYLF